MIAFIQAQVQTILDQAIVASMHGVGLHIYTPRPAQYQLNQTIELHIYMHWNEEQGPSLFGFLNVTEKLLFQTIISCDGVGPKLALTIMNNTDGATFVNAITTGNSALLSTIPGIGKKKAEQLILHLKDKVAKLIENDIVLNSSNLSELHQVSQVLASLRYSKQEIHAALEYVQAHQQSTAFDSLLRLALSFLSKKA